MLTPNEYNIYSQQICQLQYFSYTHSLHFFLILNPIENMEVEDSIQISRFSETMPSGSQGLLYLAAE